jgi:hypothetical protein
MTTWVCLVGHLLVLPILAVVRGAIAAHKEALRRGSIQLVVDKDWDYVHLVDHTADGTFLEIVTRRSETLDNSSSRNSVQRLRNLLRASPRRRN